MSTRFWDGKNFTKVEDFSKVDQFDRDKSRDEVESEKILEKLGEDDYRVSPRPTLQAAPRGLKYRKKYIQELESHVKQEEKFSIENIEKILGEMVAAQQQQRKEKTPKGLDEIKDEVCAYRWLVLVEKWGKKFSQLSLLNLKFSQLSF